MFEIVRLTLFCIILVVLGIIDMKKGLIPNKIVYPAIPVSIVLSVISDEIGIVNSLIGGVSVALFFVLAALLLRNLGMGDIKLGLLMGLMTGFPGGIIALVSGVFLGGLVAIILVITRLKNRKDTIPYGPYLAAGTIFTLIGMQFGIFDFLYAL
jgi:leader peptidase (prepilin peptidase)/N-methyltransferase